MTPSAAPLPGAHVVGGGVTFALVAPHAEGVTLVLFDRADADREAARLDLARAADGTWSLHVPGLAAGQPYAYRVHGPWAPERGHCFNPAKLLVDPYARAVDRPFAWHEALASHDRRDTAPLVPRSLVVHDAVDWEDDRPPRTPWADTVIYEAHVKGLTARHPAVPVAERGTFLGVASDAMLAHYRRLGITAVELLPVQQHAPDEHVSRLGLVNYWGYATIGFFLPDLRFAAEAARVREEFRTMVRRLHAAGIEVLLDVVYNHTAEGPPHGPVWSLRGVDNAAYYALDPAQPGHYRDVTGCGNTLDLGRAPARQLVLDSLRYWVEAMHVDGFRFDLAPALTREEGRVRLRGAFLAAVAADPVLSQVKLIAEPWDLGPDGYVPGGFPPGWAEWNGRYRDEVRRFWRGDRHQLGRLASALAGSSELYDHHGRPPQAGVNFVACHDGFTLHDLVSYAEKHNEANREGNRDGASHDASANWGVEGRQAPPHVRALRQRVMRSFLLTLVGSLGVPMLQAGDERGRTQEGNNNAYCHDGPLTWVDWTPDGEAEALTQFVADALALRAHAPALRRGTWVRGHTELGELQWFAPAGHRMGHEDWARGDAAAVLMWVRPDAAEAAALGEAERLGVLVAVNGGAVPVECRLPPLPSPWAWRVALNSAGTRDGGRHDHQLRLVQHAAALLRAERVRG